MSSLPFHNDAIVLSGDLGSRLKCSILSEYYPLWWRITSGGSRLSHSIPTAIIEMNAATGEIFIEETRETILGSAGHALNLKIKDPNTRNLKILLIEENDDCFFHLKNVIRKRWSSFEPKIKYAEGPIDTNYTNIYLLNKKLEEALDIIENIELGISIFFFDPLLCTEWTNSARAKPGFLQVRSNYCVLSVATLPQTTYHKCLVSNPSSDPFLEFSILFPKFLFQDDLFSPDEDEPEYNVDHNSQQCSNNTTPNNDQS